MRGGAEPPPTDEAPGERVDRLRRELVARARRMSPTLTTGQFFSHDTALAVLGVPLPSTPAAALPLHIAAHRPAGQPRRSEAIGHRLQARAPAGLVVAGIPVEHPVRAWRQVAATWALDDLVAAADRLVCPRFGLATLDELRAEVALLGDTREAILTRALREVRIGAETADETRLRLLLARAGLPEPELDRPLHTREGRFVARLGLAYPAYRVAVEHEGRSHACDDHRFARGVDRGDAIRAQGWAQVRILGQHLRPDPAVALDRVVTALRRHGWRPARR